MTGPNIIMAEEYISTMWRQRTLIFLIFIIFKTFITCGDDHNTSSYQIS